MATSATKSDGVPSINVDGDMRKLWVVVLLAVGTLAVIPALSRAQMAPGTGRAPGMSGGMMPNGGPIPQRQEPTNKPAGAPSPAAPTVNATSRTEGMMGVAPEHPAATVPFYRERTFLLLLGVAMTSAGFLVYRLAWSRARRRRGPASFVTEAVLVVDLVESTHLATHYGDGLAMRARTLLKERTLAATEGHGLAFSENTGDGSFMTFPSVLDAVQTATKLLKDLGDRPPDLTPGPPIGVRVGISYGEILLDPTGTRHGAVINRAFRLEGITREGFTQVEEGLQREAIPDRNRIFLDEEAAQEVRAEGIPMRVLGFCSLKGFSGLHRVYEVLWDARG
ncbi:MAG TPA: adenylate/guanylate cyclase domain-containing protein [Candidatus Methylomirabilis sp.]|nr:adenylate/guanylate cyclase domain-containing protein [Candidatus Methylomirabilis sp.]